MPRVLNFIRDSSAVTAVEYVIVASLIAMAIVAGVSLLGKAVENLFATVANNWPT